MTGWTDPKTWRRFCPPDALCDKCEEPLAFRLIPEGQRGAGKWMPCNPDGSDHFDICREVAIRKGLRSASSGASPPKMSVSCYKGPTWRGDVPPWDPSLSKEWRPMTAEEVVEQYPEAIQ